MPDQNKIKSSDQLSSIYSTSSLTKMRLVSEIDCHLQYDFCHVVWCVAVREPDINGHCEVTLPPVSLQSYPVMLGDIDTTGSLNAQIIHQLANRLRGKVVVQVRILIRIIQGRI